MGRRDSAGAMRRDAAEGGKRCGERARAGGWRGAWGAAGLAGGGEPEGREREGREVEQSAGKPLPSSQGARSRTKPGPPGSLPRKTAGALRGGSAPAPRPCSPVRERRRPLGPAGCLPGCCRLGPPPPPGEGGRAIAPWRPEGERDLTGGEPCVGVGSWRRREGADEGAG